FTVSPKQTAAGTADMMSHTFENYFTNVKGAYLQASLCEAVLKTCIKYGPIALEEPENYEARANLMWAGSLAINGLLSGGAEVGWCVHPMEHELSAFYDITHGEGLAILTPVWMKFVLKKDPSKTVQLAAYGRNVWGLDGDDTNVAESAIDKTAEFFFKTMKMPANLRAVGITEKVHFEEMAKKAAAGSEGSFVPLTAEDIVSIFEAAF
ncbi:MAG: iron-containing alcohol dehydrogenase, partial [Oscillospiraceae bacterium]|nr:iron-containing alcohol dehydrogenase [Oscillospiraceae bacterium]